MSDNYDILCLRAQQEVDTFLPQLRNIIASKYGKPFLLEYRIKSLESLKRKQKLWKREYGNIPNIDSLPDIVGYRISVDDETDCEVLSDIISQSLSPQSSIDYFHQPRETGFKAFLYYLQNTKVNSEVQIMSSKMRDWADETHDEHERTKYGVATPGHKKQ